MAKKNWEYIDVSEMNFNDKKTWELLRKGETDGVFQLESAGMKETCIRVKPTCMEDLIAILALYRPDTMAELEHFIRRKNGEEEITYLHPHLKPILKATYGCMIYQEQVMAITKVFAGFSDAEADKFRKGIGKKNKALVKEQADKFRNRCIGQGYSEEVANALADYLEKMGGYMFNKGHATGYGITSYKTAWLKANYPVQFMCSLLSNQKKSTGATDYESVGLYLMKSIEMDIDVHYPDINKARGAFSIYNSGIMYGINLIKGVGINAVNAILKLRPFNSFEDFLEKTEKEGVVNKTVIISLIKAGAFDYTKCTRSDLPKVYEKYRFVNGLDDIKPIKSINKTHIEKMIKTNIVRGNEADDKELCLSRWNKWRKLQHEKEWEEKEMQGDEYKWEYDSISYHLKGNPFEGVDLPLWADYEEDIKDAKVGGTVISIKKTKIKKGRHIGKIMAFINLDTSEGIREVVVFSEIWDRQQDKLEKGAMIVARGKKQGEKMILNGLKTLDDYKAANM